MKPIQFPEMTRTLQPSGKQYSDNIQGVEPLPIYTDGEQCISCWRPSWRERLSILFFGRVWLSVLSGSRQPPVAVNGVRTSFERVESYDTERSPDV